MSESLHDRVRKRAYFLWEQDSRPNGKDLEHWLRAEFLEQGSKPAPAGREEFRAWAQVLLVPLVLFALGYWLKDTVDQAFKERELEQSGLAEVRGQLSELYSENIVVSQARQAALAIGAFGGVAAPPLIEAVNLGGSGRREAAKRGLIVAGRVDPAPVCETLAETVANDRRMFQWWTKQEAVELLGLLHCKDSLLPLRRFCALLRKGEEAFRSTVPDSSDAPRAGDVAAYAQNALAEFGEDADCCPPGFRCGRDS